MRKYLLLFIVVQTLSLFVSAQQASLQSPHPCTKENLDPSQPWVEKFKILDSYAKDDPLPSFIGTFRDKNQKYMLDLYQDATGIFGELSSPVLDADSPTSRLYEVSFDPSTMDLQFSARFWDGHLLFSGRLSGRVIKATITRNNRTEKVTLRRTQDTDSDEFFFTSRAQFECAMTLWNRF